MRAVKARLPRNPPIRHHRPQPLRPAWTELEYFPTRLAQQAGSEVKAKAVCLWEKHGWWYRRSQTDPWLQFVVIAEVVVVVVVVAAPGPEKEWPVGQEEA